MEFAFVERLSSFGGSMDASLAFIRSAVPEIQPFSSGKRGAQ